MRGGAKYKPWSGLGHRGAKQTLATANPRWTPPSPIAVAGEGWGTPPHALAATAAASTSPKLRVSPAPPPPKFRAHTMVRSRAIGRP